MKPGRVARRDRQYRKALLSATGLVAALLLIASGYLWLIGAGMGPHSRSAAIGGPFRLVDGDGQSVTDRSFRGKYLLIYFGYTSCPDVCPTALATLAAALDDLGEKAERVQPVFITVDPQRDTPAVVQQYVSSFTPRLIGLTGSPDEVRKITEAYRVTSVIHRANRNPASDLVDHSSVIYLVGPDGRYVAPIRADGAGNSMARAIAGHLS
jgi:protein SCO1